VNTLPQTGTWTADPAATTARFEVSNFLVSTVPGTITVTSGTVETDELGRPTTVSAVLDARSIATGHPRRDKDLRAPRFFDVDRQPEIRFSGSSAAGVEGGWTVEGTLLVGRHAAPMTLTVEHRPTDDPGTVAVVARGTLDRSAAGIRAPAFMIGHRVQVTVHAVLSPVPAEVRS